MSTSNEIPDRDFERQSANRTRARAFFDAVTEAMESTGVRVSVGLRLQSSNVSNATKPINKYKGVTR